MRLLKSLRYFGIEFGTMIKWHLSNVCLCRGGFHSDLWSTKIPRPVLLGRRRWEKNKQKWWGCSMRNLAPTRCLAHLCLSVSSSYFYYFPFPHLRPRRGGLPCLLYSLSLRRIISSFLYTVLKNYVYMDFIVKSRNKNSWSSGKRGRERASIFYL